MNLDNLRILVLYFITLIKFTGLGWAGLGMWCVWVRGEGCVGSCWGNRRERDHWGDLGVDG
jgi:hypothetical protein